MNTIDAHMGMGGPDDNSAQAGHLIANCLQERYGKGPDSDCTSTLVVGHQNEDSRRNMGASGVRSFPDHRGGNCGGDIAHALTAGGHDASEDGTGRGTPLVATAYRTSGNCGVMEQGDKTAALTTSTDPTANIVAFQCHGSNVGPMGTLRSGNGNETGGVPFTFQTRFTRNGRGAPDEITGALTSSEGGTHAGTKPHVALAAGVRRLTPRECERLMAFPDDWTRWGADGKEISDSARYRMLGNSIVTTVAEWIGRRIVETERNR